MKGTKREEWGRKERNRGKGSEKKKRTKEVN
jgi:hypothetical protein